MKRQVILNYRGQVLFEAPGMSSLRDAVVLAARQGVNLRGAELRGADLRDIILSGVNLSGVNLRGANLRGADLHGSDLRRAILGRADLIDAVLDGADLRGTVGIISAGTPNGFTAFGWLRDGFLSIRIGCQEKRLSEAIEYWHKGKKHRRQVRAAVKYIAKCAKDDGWPLMEREAWRL